MNERERGYALLAISARNLDWIKMKRPIAVLISISSIWLMTTWLLGSWLVVSSPLEKADAIVVLAGGADYRERALEAARLYRKGVSSRIILTNDGVKSGWSSELNRNPYFVERAKWALVESGASEIDIEIVPGIVESGFLTGTEIEARMVIDYSRAKKFQTLQIVTSAYHSRRVSIIYQKGIYETNDSATIGVSFPDPYLFDLPNAFWWLSVESWEKLTSEYFKIAYTVAV